MKSDKNLGFAGRINVGVRYTIEMFDTLVFCPMIKVIGKKEGK